MFTWWVNVGYDNGGNPKVGNIINYVKNRGCQCQCLLQSYKNLVKTKGFWQDRMRSFGGEQEKNE